MGAIRRTVTVSVSSTAAGSQTGGRLEVEIDPFSGAPGASSTVTIRAFEADGDPAAGVSVDLRVSAGAGTLIATRLTTDTNGTASTQFIRGSAVGSSYYIFASATGYPDRNENGNRLVIATTGGTAGSSQTAGEPDAIDVYSGDGQVGTPNTRLAEPIVVEVVDANDNPVEDVRVRFRTTIGSGRFSTVLPRTGRNGRAQTFFTPTSTGRIRVSAAATGVDNRAAFIVQAGEPADALVKVSGDDQSGTPGNALADPFVVEVQDEGR